MALPPPRLLSLLLALSPWAVFAAEGMWPLNRLPLQAIEKETGVRLDGAWLARAQAAAVNVGRSSGSLVSPHGLVLTNQHVVRNCIAALSNPGEDLDRQGFVAATRDQERRCPGLSVRLLETIEDLPAALPAEAGARRAEIARIERDCSHGDLRCSVVALYGGAQHHLYKQREYGDIRLVMAAEAQAVHFGGDDDNFAYPRFSLDMALLRIYGPDGQALRSPQWLRPAQAALQLGDPVFVLGQPRQTERALTVAQLDALRERLLPLEIADNAHELQAMQAYARTGPEAARQAATAIASLANRLKVQRGELASLNDPALQATQRAQEARLRQAASDDGPWRLAEASAQAQLRLEPQIAALRPQRGSLMALALGLAQWHQETQRPEPARLPEARGSALARLEELLRADVSHHPALEQLRLQTYIERARAHLGEAHPAVRLLLAGREPAQAAAHWLRHSQLDQATVRRRWMDRPAPKTWQQPQDSLLALALQLQDLRRPALLAHETEIKSLQAQAAAQLAQARWRLLGESEAPDGNGQLRLSYGRTTEMELGGLRQPWKTTVGGLYARADAFDQQAAYALSPRLAARRAELPAATPLNFVADTDTIGGHSGSPLLDARGDLVGLLFDGNLGSLGARFHFDARHNRTVALHLDALFLALERIHDAAHLAREMRAPQ